ncbi:WD40 repeat domain-containing protein [Scytonema sp. UIC 10036]|uniref:WD40 repeat domain-containing protein n=1 Tax=Scytonema sp. UIC 10036 TaxID=2304196 RepID=UPI0012DAEB59|nr:WD40 repeat domain-containing protein [Scytonema sp. UIC 10036]MUG94802.1 WD40 repeat domain-containing protein [Scytonema sp. UIC 10036]
MLVSKKNKFAKENLGSKLSGGCNPCLREKIFQYKWLANLKSQIFSKKNFITLLGLASATAIVPLFPISSTVLAEEQTISQTQDISVPEPSTNFTNARLLYSFRENIGTIKSLAFSPNGQILAGGGAENEGIIRIWSMSTGKIVARIDRAHKTAVESILISPDGQTLASASSDNTINLWNLGNNRFTRSFVGHTSNVLSLAVTPDSKILASGALDGIRLWDLLQQRPLATLVRFDNFIYSLAISPDGQTLVSGDRRGIIKFWDLNSGRLIRTIPSAHVNTITKIVFTPDGSNFVSASRDRTIKIWDTSTGTLVRTLTGHNNWVNAITISPNGQTLASAGRDGIKLWNLTTGELLNTLYGHTDWVSTIAFSPNGIMLASGGFDRRVNIWLAQ